MLTTDRGNPLSTKPIKIQNQIKRNPRKNEMHLTVTSLQCQCLIWLMMDQGNLRKIQANKTPKTNKKETAIERGSPCDSEIPEWLQEFRENLAVDEIHEHGDSHASSSHEVSLEPTTKRREDLCKHSVYTHFPTDRNCEIWQRTEITRAQCRRRNGGAVPRAENFGDLITSDHKVLSGQLRISKQSPVCSRGAGSSHSMDPGISVQDQKLHKKPREVSKSSWSPIGILKSFTLTVP